MQCDRCGSEVPANSRFCPNCGAALSPVAAPPAGPGNAGAPDDRVARRPASGVATAAPDALPGAAGVFAATGFATLDSGGAGSARASGGGAVATPRRRADRPVMVPLSEFGKAPPPPPRVLFTTRNVLITVGSLLIVVALVVAGFVFYGGQGSAGWSGVRCIDVRTGC